VKFATSRRKAVVMIDKPKRPKPEHAWTTPTTDEAIAARVGVDVSTVPSVLAGHPCASPFVVAEVLRMAAKQEAERGAPSN
jgi:hypothetical protein